MYVSSRVRLLAVQGRSATPSLALLVATPLVRKTVVAAETKALLLYRIFTVSLDSFGSRGLIPPLAFHADIMNQ